MSVSLRKGLAALLFAVMALALTLESQAQAPRRERWVSQTDTFTHVGGKRWVMGGGTPAPSANRELVELSRNAQYIFLRDSATFATFYRLFNDHYESMFEERWDYQINGSWQ